MQRTTMTYETVKTKYPDDSPHQSKVRVTRQDVFDRYNLTLSSFV